MPYKNILIFDSVDKTLVFGHSTQARETGVVHWSELSSPTSATWVRILGPASWVDLSLLLVRILVPRVFSPGCPVFLPPQKPTLHSLIRTLCNEFMRALPYFVGKLIIFTVYIYIYTDGRSVHFSQHDSSSINGVSTFSTCVRHLCNSV